MVVGEDFVEVKGGFAGNVIIGLPKGGVEVDGLPLAG